MVSETIREMEERSSRGSRDHSEPRHIKSQRALGGEGDEHGGCTADYKHQEVIPWSSSVETERKKKRILKGKKRDMYEVSKISDELRGREDQTDVHKDTEIGKRNSTDAGSAPRQTDKGKKKKQKLSSSAWMNFFRGKSDTKDEALKQEKPRKERIPLQKSQSFHSGSTPSPRSNQLNRMDSFRKLFKRPRDAASTSECLGEGKPAERKTCLEISSPIVKPGFRSNILVDRGFFLAQKDRSPHLEKDRLKGDKKKGEIDVDNPDSPKARRGSNSGGPLKNGSFNISGSEPAPPVAPIRRKHLERKRLSRAGEEGLLKWTDDNGAVESILDKHPKLGAKIQCDKYSEYTSNNQNGNFINMVVGEPSEKLEPLESAAESCLERTKPGDNARETDVILHHEPKLSDLKSNNDDLAIAHDLSPTGQVGVGESQTSQSPRGVYENGGTEENYEDVFHDCEDNTKLSFDSATVAEKDGEMRTVSTIANSHDSSRRWQSDVSSSESKTAIETAKKKTSQSFSGGKLFCM